MKRIRQKILLLLCFSIFPAFAFAQFEITEIEYFFNTDPGFGNGISITYSPTKNEDVSFNADLASLTPGTHLLFIRAKNSNNEWGMIKAIPVIINDAPSSNIPTEITEIEYFSGTDPGFGQGIALSISADNEHVINENIPELTFVSGSELLHVRAKNSFGLWGLTRTILFNSTLFSISGEPMPVSEIEYFLNDDPGFGQGIPISIFQNTEISFDGVISLPEMQAHSGVLFFRAKFSDNSWGLTKGQAVMLSLAGISAEPGMLTGLEYFFNEDPGFGNGTFVSVENEPMIEITVDALASDLDPGSHVFYARVRSSNGLWGQIVQAPFETNENVRTVVFVVDMSIQQANGFFNPDNQSVYVRGEFNNWALASMEYTVDGLFETERHVFGLEGEEIGYKYYFATSEDVTSGTWESEVGPGADGNRVLTLSPVNEAMILHPVFFNNQETVIEVPNVVTLILPAHESTNVGVIPEFIWGDADRAISYHFQLSTSATFDEHIYDVDGIFETSLSPENMLAEQTIHFWRVRARNLAGYSDWSEAFEFTTLRSTSFEGHTIPTVYALMQNYPNPFNPVTIIRFDLPETTEVLLEVYNLAGQRVTVLKSGLMQAGSHQVVFKTTPLSSGMYLYRLQAGEHVFFKKMTLIK
jgi:hypothetical protein